MKHTYIAYLCVSTTKQSLHGVSLQEQRRSIAQHAEKHGLTIHVWHEEVESASKGRRCVFAVVHQGELALTHKKCKRGAELVIYAACEDSYCEVAFVLNWYLCDFCI